MFNESLITLYSALLFLSGCFSQPEVSRYDKITDSYCACTARLIALNQQAAKGQKEGVSQEIFQKNLQEIQDEYINVRDCSASIIAQFGALHEADYPEVEKRLTAKCPELAQQRDLLQEMLGE